MRKKFLSLICLLVFAIGSIAGSKQTNADLFGVGIRSNEVYLFNQNTGARSVFNVLPTSVGTSLFLTGIAVNPNTGRVYVSSFGDGVFTFDGTTPNSPVTQLPGTFTGAGTTTLFAGITVNPLNGNVYVANTNFSTASIRVFNSAGVEQASLPGVGTGGLLFRNVGPQGQLLVGSGLFGGAPGALDIASIDIQTPSNIGVFAASNLGVPINQLAADASGNIYAGTTDTGANGSSNVYRYASNGTLTGNPWQTVSSGILPIVPKAGMPSNFTSPAGVTIDADGNIYVGVQGNTNLSPESLTEMAGGTVLKYNSAGTLISGFNAGAISINSLAMRATAVPEPGTIALLGMAGGLVYLRRRRIARIHSVAR
jgi:DNA-binding beta-propeller fold protein YncE